jgi:Leucine-rich repeat (LRR) protein
LAVVLWFPATAHFEGQDVGIDKPLGKHRIEFFDRLTQKEVQDLATNPNLRILQTASPVSSETWELLNQNLFALRPDVELRVYGFYSSMCDLSFVKAMSNVRRVSADCLMRAVGIEHLADLENLDELYIGIFSLESFDFLSSLPSSLKSLTLGPTKSKKPHLKELGRFRSLRKLGLAGQQNGIAIVADLRGLEQLSLRAISTPNLDYVSILPSLWSLDILLGGIRNLSAISGKKSINYLELCRIRELSDVTVLSSLVGLQYLDLRELRNVTDIPDLSRLTKLRKLVLDNMKGLKDVSAIGKVPALEGFLHISAQGFLPEPYWNLLNKPSLQQAHIGFCSQPENERFQALVRQSGRPTYQRTEFVFR